ncbi:MAG: prolipoprotein diacylglyceryl transferase family protein [Acidobacteriota bacterium]
MTFPVYFKIASLQIHPHWIFESLAYFIGFRIYLRLRKNTGDHLDSSNRLWIVVAAAVGAALGSKLLYWLENPALTLQNWNNPFYLMAGKTVVGGLLGGFLAVEIAKKILGITRRTGDLFAIPLTLAIAIGRIGCFLSGLGDETYGIATALPTGIDFGDGVSRHPTQLYEAGFLLLLGFWIYRLSQHAHREGDPFKLFMVGYMGFRLLIDFIKPAVAFGGLTAIQWACLLALVYYARDLPYLFHIKESESL